jgi:hypothetical protein
VPTNSENKKGCVEHQWNKTHIKLQHLAPLLRRTFALKRLRHLGTFALGSGAFEAPVTQAHFTRGMLQLGVRLAGGTNGDISTKLVNVLERTYRQLHNRRQKAFVLKQERLKRASVDKQTREAIKVQTEVMRVGTDWSNACRYRLE